MADFTNNTTQLQSLLEKVNALPEAGSGGGSSGGVEVCNVTFVNCNHLHVIGTQIYKDGSMNAIDSSLSDGIWKFAKNTALCIYDYERWALSYDTIRCISNDNIDAFPISGSQGSLFYATLTTDELTIEFIG